MTLIIHLKLLILSLIFLASVESYENTCGYQSCPSTDGDSINVHLVAHTHDDVGWLKTPEQYYYGLKTDVQRAGVQYILDTVVDELEKDERRRFIFVETYFFNHWWREQNEKTRDRVKNLVKNGRLMFVNAGWTMNDEATTHYSAIIDQMTLGHKRLESWFGECGEARIAWQIDPFGHSREQASLFAQMNFDGLFFGRLDWRDKNNREIKKEMEMIWKGSDDLDSDLFTGVLRNGYNPPDGFCFDDTCGDKPIVDDPSSVEFNYDKIIAKFIDAVREQAQWYSTNHIMMTMGSDFQYQNAHIWFKNLDKLISGIEKYQQKTGLKTNQMPIKAFYSTPDCYLLSLNQLNRTWPTKSDDFFPYASAPHSYWTGYFVSRPAIKLYERESNAALNSLETLQVLSGLGTKFNRQIDGLRDAMGVMQHHDAVAGTEKQNVADDYVRLLYKAVDEARPIVTSAYSKLLSKDGSSVVRQEFCRDLNISSCDYVEKQRHLAVNIFNPYGHPINHEVRLPTSCAQVSVFDYDNKPVSHTLIPVGRYVTTLKFRKTNATHEVVFTANVPGLTVATFYVETSDCSGLSKRRNNRNRKQKIFNGKGFRVKFNEDGNIDSVYLDNGKKVEFNQKFKIYRGMNGDNRNFDKQASGAYIFRPNGTIDGDEFSSKSVEFTSDSQLNQVQLTMKGGKSVDFISQTWRVSPNRDYMEMDYLIGPLDVDDKIGKELVSVFSTDISTNGTFYTDSNGRQMMKRIRNYRETYNYTNTESIAGNYYPINSRIAIVDEKKNVQVTVLTDRSQGGSSLNDGEIEVMINRRLLHDDAFGVGEPLNETGEGGDGLIVSGKYRIFVSSIDSAARLHRQESQKMYMLPLISFNSYKDRDSYRKQFKPLVSLGKSLPENVHLLSVEQWNDKVLIRLEHFFESKDNAGELSQPAEVDLREIFNDYVITNAEEMTLTANRKKKDAKRLKWIKADKSNGRENERYNLIEDLVVTLKPMEIRTFFVEMRKR